MATSPPIFAPPEDEIPTVLAELINPELTLCDVAVRHKTGVQALALWMQRADIAERLNALSAATAFRARALALDQLPAAVGLLRQIMEEYAVLIRAPLREAPSLKAAHHRRAATDGARRAVNLLSRLARLLPPVLAPAPPPPPPLPRAGEDRLERSDRQVRARATHATHATAPNSAPDAEAEALRSLGSGPSATPPEPAPTPQSPAPQAQLQPRSLTHPLPILATKRAHPPPRPGPTPNPHPSSPSFLRPIPISSPPCHPPVRCL